MNLKLKQLCIVLCSLSMLNSAFAANSPQQPAAPQNSSGKGGSTGSPTSNSGNTGSQPSAASSATSDNKVVLNFENADIQTVIKAISKLSGKNFVVDPRVKGTVNIVSEKPISKAESYKVLESALRMQGFATVEADGVIKVLPETDARTYGMRTENGTSSQNPGDQLITKIFIIDKGSATQLSNALRPMISPNNTVSVYPNSNALVVTDYASNMTRITKIINDLNATQATGVAPVTIHLSHAVAADVAATLQSYMGTSGSGSSSSSSGSNDGPSATVTVDSNSNSIIIASNVSSKLAELKGIALSLDQAATNSNNNLHVVYLRNSDAAHVAEVLRTIASGQDNPDLAPSPANRAISDTSSALGGSNGSGGGGSPFGGSGGGGSRPPTQTSSSQNRSSSSSSQQNDKNAPKVLIQAEPTTNALIIQAPEAVYRNLRMVINMLDVRRVQVMIEVLIADINATQQGTFGIQWVGGAGNNNVGAIAVSNYAGNGSSLSSLATSAMSIAASTSGTGAATGQTPTIPGEVYVGLVTGTTTVGGQTIPTISTLADMLAANSSSNILGRPTLLTLDNEEASIFVGQQIGVPSGSFSNSAAAPGSISTSVNRQNVGTQIRLKPLVTQSGAIQMSVYEEDSQQNTGGQTVQEIIQNGPTLNSRNLKTQILVDDGQIIALGGLTSDSVSLQMNGIPLLSSIPYVGWLFSWQNRVHNKSNMVIFLRPVIVRNEEGYKALTNQRYRYVMDQENAVFAKGNALLPDIKAVNIENQVPFNNSVPPQPVVQPSEPIVDLRPNSPSVNAAKAQSAAMASPDGGSSTSNNPTITVKQPASNSVVITNN